MIGIDLVDVDRFARVCPDPDCHFARALFTARERRRFGTRPALLAACFGAKEAVAKALGVGLTVAAPPGVPARAIEVIAGAPGRAPSIRLRGAASRVARREGLGGFTATWTMGHGAGLACVVAVGWRES